MKNISGIDRFLRLLLAVLLLETAFFWLAGTPALVTYALAAVMGITSAWGFCPLYRLLGIGGKRTPSAPAGLALRMVAIALLLGVALGGSYASQFFTRKLFLEDFNAMNAFYKQTLFLTGKGERDKAIANYELLLPAYQRFQDKYTAYQPSALRNDRQLLADLSSVAGMFKAVNDGVRTGDLHQAHLDLEKVRPVFQELFKRNGFSMLSVSLVDFHDVMELILDAAQAKDAAKISALYPQVSEKLQAVEAEANDAEIVAIRSSLDALLALAKDSKTEQLPAQAERLKSSFIKVYLKRG
jgi:Protein of unknown function (DUF2892)